MNARPPPATAPSPYITPQGARHLRDELQQLLKVERPQLTQAVADAAAQGDRSENAEYIYGKKRLRELDRRIGYLSRRLDAIRVVSELPANTERIYFGAWVTLADGRGRRQRFRIVGTDEIDTKRGHISIDGPLARSLLGKEAKARVAVTTPAGTTQWTVLEVRYEPP